MKLSTAQVIGLNTDQKAAQVIANSSGENYFFALLDLTSDDAFTRGRQALGELSDFYFEQEAVSDGEKLIQTFQEAKKKFEGEEFSLLLATVSGKVLYLISKGKVEVYLKRGLKFSPLNLNSEEQLISGFLEEGDRILFSTQSLINFLGTDLTSLLELPIQSFEEEIVDRLGVANIEEQGLAGLLSEIEIPKADEEIPIRKEQVIPNLQAEEKPNYTGTAFDNSYLNKQSPFKNMKKLALGFVGFLWGKRKHLPKSNQGRLILGIILILVLILGVFFGIKSKKGAQIQKEVSRDLQNAQDDLTAAKGLSSLNPSDAKSKLDQAKSEVQKALSLKPGDSKALDLKKQIEQDAPGILQQYSISDFPTFLDLDLIKKNFRPTQMSLSTGKLLLLDPNLKSLVLIDISKKSNQVLAGQDQLGDAQMASLNGDLAFVYSKDKGVLRIDTQNQKVTSVAKSDSDWGVISDLYAFSGNVYLLDALKNQIWKYLPASDAYSDKRTYLTASTKANLQDSIRLQIESSVYILKRGGEILRFTSGVADNFSLSGLPSSLNNPKSIFVSSDTSNLYVLDSGNSRVLILSKTGEYKSQISGDKFSQATDLVVDEAAKKLYLLSSGKIYSVDLK